MKQSIILASISLVLVVLGFTALLTGLERQERYECAKWQQEANRLRGYYMTKWQIDQCARYNNKD